MQRLDRILFAVVLLLPAVPAWAQSQARRDSTALVVIECESQNGVCAKQHVVAYEFGPGRVSREIVLTLATDRIRFDLGQNHLYRERYLISNWGDIIDIKKKRLLHEGDGEYVGVEGDRVIQRVERRNFRGYFYYDLKSGKYVRWKSPGKWALPGVLAPNETQSVSSDSFNADVRLHRVNGTKRLLATGLTASVTGCDLPTVPLLWLSNELVLTQRADGDLITLDLRGRISPLLKIPTVPSEYGYAPKLYRNDIGQIVYEFVGGSYVIDVDKKQSSRIDTTWIDLGSGFQWESANLAAGKLIRFQQQDIGRWWVLSTRTTDGFIAVEYGDVGYTFGNPKGFKVWSAASREWVTVDLAWLDRLVGWIHPNSPA
jgi:hypothetical protein